MRLSMPLKQKSEATPPSYKVLSDRTPDNIKLPLSYNLLSDRTLKAIKSKVKSTSVRDRLSDRTPKAIKSKGKSTNIRDRLSDRTPKGIKSKVNRIPVIRDFELRAMVFFTSKIHALITLKMGPLLRSDVMLS
jgi:hypothetical protein